MPAHFGHTSGDYPSLVARRFTRRYGHQFAIRRRPMPADVTGSPEDSPSYRQLSLIADSGQVSLAFRASFQCRCGVGLRQSAGRGLPGRERPEANALPARRPGRKLHHRQLHKIGASDAARGTLSPSCASARFRRTGSSVCVQVRLDGYLGSAGAWCQHRATSRRAQQLESRRVMLICRSSTMTFHQRIYGTACQLRIVHAVPRRPVPFDQPDRRVKQRRSEFSWLAVACRLVRWPR